MKTVGLIAAPPTAFQSDGEIDLAAVGPLAAHLQRQGVAGVFVNGTTGEGPSLSSEEREALAAEWRRAWPRELRLFVHVGHNSLPEARRLARHAQAVGADAIAALAPGFFRPAGVEALAAWCAEVAAAAPACPFYYYHMPAMTGVQVNVAAFLEHAAERIPTLAGVKFTYEAMADFLLCQRLRNGRFDVLWGRDEMLLGALATGATGAVGSTYNVIAPLFLRLLAAFRAGDHEQARSLQAAAVGFIDRLVASGNFFAALKMALVLQGVPISPAVRAPLLPLADGVAEPLRTALQADLDRIMGSTWCRS